MIRATFCIFVLLVALAGFAAGSSPTESMTEKEIAAHLARPTPVEVRMLVLYSDAVLKREGGDKEATKQRILSALVREQLNRVFGYSRVKVRWIVEIQHLPNKELKQGNGIAPLDQVWNRSGYESMRDTLTNSAFIRALRDMPKVQADLVVVLHQPPYSVKQILSNNGGVTGLAGWCVPQADFLDRKLPFCARGAFALVNYESAMMDDHLAFAHEIGHMFGARHIKEADDRPPALAYGNPTTGVRDVMTYPGQCAGCKLAREYSHPGPCRSLGSGAAECGIRDKRDNASAVRRNVRWISCAWESLHSKDEGAACVQVGADVP